MLDHTLHLSSLSYYDVLLCAVTLTTILWFSVLAARAESKIWRRLNRSNGERREQQRKITLGRSHLR